MLKRLLLFLFIAGIALLGLFIYVNLRTVSEPLPVVTISYGEEAASEGRPWWQATTVYQVYPRSFQDSDGDGIGDLRGIIDRLDYIKQLGFETIWFSPFFSSPQQDIGYDVSDYYGIAPEYGDSALADSLIQEIHRRDMKVVFDLVLNHTSDQHPWFVESKRSRDNPRADWYVWQDGKNGGPPTNWHSALGSSGWHYAPERDQWYYSAFLPFQPDLNYHHPEVRAAMLAMVRHWLERGVDGFRLDIFNFLYEDPEFHDNPSTWRYLPSPDMVKMNGQERIYNLNRPETFAFAKELHSLLDEFQPDRFLVGEVFGYPSQLRQLMGADNDGLHMVFLFDLTHFRWKADFFREKLRSFEAFYPYPSTPTAVFSNHDLGRSFSRLGEDPAKARLLALMQFTLRAVPFTYQGEELGMSSAQLPMKTAKDSLAHYFLKAFPKFLHGLPIFFNRDNCRTPMQWDSTAHAGFTEEHAEPWLPVHDKYLSVNVAREMQDPASLLHLYQQLLALRKQAAPLKWGSFRLLEGDEWPKDVLAYERIFRDERLIVLLNFSETSCNVPVSGDPILQAGKWKGNTLDGQSGVILRMR